MKTSDLDQPFKAFVDCHCHLSFLDEKETSSLIQSWQKSQASEFIWVMGGYQPSEWEVQVELKQTYPQSLKTCYGLHPWYVKSEEFDLSRDMEALKIWIDQADFIGEVGLDFFGDAQTLKKDLQLNVFEKQLQLSTGRPYVFHIVQAHGPALDILKDYNTSGYIHSFTGSIEVAEQYIDLGYLLSFGPNVLNPNYKKAREVLAEIPLDKLLLESDTPSHPLDEADPMKNLQKVYEEVSRIRGLSMLELADLVNSNFQRLIGGQNESGTNSSQI